MFYNNTSFYVKNVKREILSIWNRITSVKFCFMTCVCVYERVSVCVCVCVCVCALARVCMGARASECVTIAYNFKS